MSNISAAINAEISGLQQQASAAGDLPALEQVLDRIAALHNATQDARQVIADLGRSTVLQALKAGADPEALVGRPYSESQVRKFARDAGLPPKKRGPRRRVLTQSDSE